jgi:tetratricopeptide (TPR) repeat protein
MPQSGYTPYTPSIAELNQKAQAMMTQGDTAGAISRLEAALDLQPNEPNTMHNLAVAYQAGGQHDKAIAMYQQLLEKKLFKPVEIYQSLGILHEEKADMVWGKAEIAKDDQNPDIKKTEAELRQQALDGYRQAIEMYKKSIEAGNTSEDVAARIPLLEARLDPSKQAARQAQAAEPVQ